MPSKKIYKIIIGIEVIILIVFLAGLYFFRKERISLKTETKITFAENIILIGWDGVQRDHLKENLEKGELPNLKKLAENGSSVLTKITTGATETKPGWAEILTGYGPKITGVYSNKKFTPIPEGYTILERLENHFGRENIVTIFIAGKGKNLGQPQENTSKNFDVFEVNVGEADQVGSRALELLEKYQDKKFFAFFHFNEPDYLGHEYGENSAEYNKGIIIDDEWLGKIIFQLQELNLSERTTIYVTTDHGFNEGEKDHFYDPETFLVSNDPAILRNGDRKDIAPTILEKFGIDLVIFEPKLEGQSLYH